MTNGEDKPWLEEVPAEAEKDGFIEKYRPQIILAGVVVLVAFLGLIFYAYQSGQNGAPPEPPLVTAPEGPAKQKPEDPGGIDIPDRDKLVYNRVSGGEEEEGVNLEPGPELPQDVPTAPEETEAPDVTPEELEDETAQPVEDMVEESVEETVEEPVTDPAPPAGNFLVQLGAFGSRDSAMRAWETLKAKHAAVLGGLAPDYEPLKRAGGTLYRLRAGGFADRAAAEAACAKLKAQGQGCFPAER